MVIIIAGHWRTRSDADRDAAVAAFRDMVARGRQQDGCIDMSISAAPVDADRVNVIECWRDELALKAWRKVAKGPRISPKGVAVQLYHADDGEIP